MSRRRLASRRGWGLLLLAILLMTTPLFVGQPVNAESTWSAPALVYRTTGYLTRPRMVADASGDIHLFFYLREEASPSGEAAPSLIMYSRLHAGSWSTPTDILVGAGTESPSVAVDGQDVLHVIWQGGPNGELTYTQARSTGDITARSWSRPRVVSDAPAFDSDIAVSADAKLHIVYSDRSGSVWYRSSTDSGSTWSSISTVFNGLGSPCAANYPRVVADSGGIVHVVWTELQLPGAWPPCGALYSDSIDRGRTWTNPVVIAGPGYGQINLLATEPSTVALAWNAMVGIGERKFTWSTDGGFTWRDAGNFAPRLRGGFTGVPSIVADSSGTIHLVTSVDGQRGETQSVYHLSWDGVRWSEPALLSAGAIGARSIEMPWLAVSNGNQLHAVFEDDFQRIWYSTRSTTALPMAPRAIATPNLSATNTPAAASPVPTVNRGAGASRDGPPENAGPSSQSRNPFLLGIVPVAALLVATVLVRVFQRTRE